MMEYAEKMLGLVAIAKGEKWSEYKNEAENVIDPK